MFICGIPFTTILDLVVISDLIVVLIILAVVEFTLLVVDEVEGIPVVLTKIMMKDHVTFNDRKFYKKLRCLTQSPSVLTQYSNLALHPYPIMVRVKHNSFNEHI